MAICATGPGIVMLTRGTSTAKDGAESIKTEKGPCAWNVVPGNHYAYVETSTEKVSQAQKDKDAKRQCKVKHEGAKGIEYPNNGILTREGGYYGYVGVWPHPSVCYVYASKIISKSLPLKFSDAAGNPSGTSSQKTKPQATIPNYICDYHHVIPCKSYKKDSIILRANLILLGYNLNEGIGNGVLLPKKKWNTVWHDLQYHSSYHKAYNEQVSARLDELQTDMLDLDLCNDLPKDNGGSDNNHTQADLIKMIMNLAFMLRNKIINWEVDIYPGKTKPYREHAYANLKKLNPDKQIVIPAKEKGKYLDIELFDIGDELGVYLGDD